jgi:hypothetical protein
VSDWSFAGDYTMSKAGANCHGSATVTMPDAALRSRASVDTRVAPSEAARARYKASRTAIRSVSPQAAWSRGERPAPGLEGAESFDAL